VFFPLSIVFEDVKAVLRVNLIVKTSTMCDLIFLLHQIKFLLDRRVVLVAVLTDLEQDLNHVLHSLIDIGFVENISELIKHRQGDRTTHFLQVLPNLPCESDSNLYAVICGLVEQEKKNLCCKHLVDHLLVAQVSDERR
jgi:hypothetical protein